MKTFLFRLWDAIGITLWTYCGYQAWIRVPELSGWGAVGWGVVFFLAIVFVTINVLAYIFKIGDAWARNNAP